MDKVKTKIKDTDLKLGENRLWYKTAPNFWDQGLPVGNGRLAAMVLNYDKEDVLALNSEDVWVGNKLSRDIYSSSENALENVRKMLINGEYEKATLYAMNHLGRNDETKRYINRIDTYQPVGNLHIKFDDCELVKRELDIEQGIAKVNRNVNNRGCKGAFFAHCTLDKMFCTWSGESLSCKIFFEREFDDRVTESVEISDNSLCYSAEFDDRSSFFLTIKVFTDGNVIKNSKSIEVRDAENLTLVIDIQAQSDKTKHKKKINDFEFKNKNGVTNELQEIINCHTERFSHYMRRMSLVIDAEQSDIPTDERLVAFKNGSADENIFSLYLNYARYLMISSSVCAKLPINLQGKWNNDLEPAWKSDYHFDINLQMAYWIAENGNLSEMTEPLFNYIDSFEKSAREAAEKIYGCRGILLPLSADARGISSMESYGWDIWIGAAPWMAQHYFKHFEYTGDREFLKERAYPYFKAVIEFFEDYFVVDKDGIYQIMPSVSPENTFIDNENIHISLGISSAMDVQLAYDCFTYAIKAAEILGDDADKVKEWKNIRENLPEFKIGSDGRLLEWNEEFNEVEPGHRHFSHLYGAFPSNIFTPEKNVEQFKAAQKSLDFRLRHLGGHTGWSRAWCACLYARFGNSTEFYKHTRFLIDNFSTSSLLDLHPPRIFQIDGNLGGAEAIIQALVQCNDGKIYLLPALPKNWQNGEIKGVKTVGGHTVSIMWEDGKVKKIDIKFGYENEAMFKFNDGTEIVVSGVSKKSSSLEI